MCGASCMLHVEQVDFGEAVRTAEKEKEKLQASITDHEKQISKLTIDLTRAQDGPRPSGEKGKKQMQYYGRWTAHRAESRKVSCCALSENANL